MNCDNFYISKTYTKTYITRSPELPQNSTVIFPFPYLFIFPVVFFPVIDATQVLIWKHGDIERYSNIKSAAHHWNFLHRLSLAELVPGSGVNMWVVEQQWCTMRPSSIDFLSMSESCSIQNWLFSASSVENTITFSPVLECQSVLMNNESLTFCYRYLPLVTSQTVKRCLSEFLAVSNVRY